jgi:hypothetical protein
MRHGFFAVMARIMRVSWAARVHRIPLGALLARLAALESGGVEAMTPPVQ